MQFNRKCYGILCAKTLMLTDTSFYKSLVILHTNIIRNFAKVLSEIIYLKYILLLYNYFVNNFDQIYAIIFHIPTTFPAFSHPKLYNFATPLPSFRYLFSFPTLYLFHFLSTLSLAAIYLLCILRHPQAKPRKRKI